MQVVGYVALGVVAVGIVFGLAVAGRSMPDVSRYRRIRRM